MTLSTSYTGRMNEPQADSSTVHLQVAAEVRAHLARQRISGRRAAFALGWKQPYIARRLSGEVPFDAIARLAEWLKCYHEEVMPIAASNCPRTRLQVRDVPSGTLVDVPRPGTAMNLTGAGPGHFRSIEDATAPICSPGAPRSPSPRGSRFDRAYAVWRVL